MMLDRETWCAAQLEGLQNLATILNQSEVNYLLVPPGSDMGYIEMVDTPRAPHAIYDPDSKSYDIWKWGNKWPVMKHPCLTVEDAAEVLTAEYFMAKAKRVRKHHPDLKLPEILKKLRRGYQGATTTQGPRRDH